MIIVLTPWSVVLKKLYCLKKLYRLPETKINKHFLTSSVDDGVPQFLSFHQSIAIIVILKNMENATMKRVRKNRRIAGIDTFADLNALVGPLGLVAPRSSGNCTGASLIAEFNLALVPRRTNLVGTSDPTAERKGIWNGSSRAALWTATLHYQTVLQLL